MEERRPSPERAAADRPAARELDPHVLVASIMVAIAVFAAVTAYRQALAEQRAVSLERRLALGQLQDISYRNELLAQALVKIELVNLQRALTREAADLTSAARAVSGAGGSASDWLDWYAAELTMQEKALRRFTVSLDDLGNKGQSIEEELATRSATALREQGFDAEVDRQTPSALKFPHLQAKIDAAHKVGPQLAWCVLLFIVALVCLTLAELELGPASVWWGFVVAGSLVALGTTLAVMTIDRATAWFMAPLLLLLFIVPIWAFRTRTVAAPSKRGSVAHPDAPEPNRPPIAHLTAPASHDPWSQKIVIRVALAVLVSAGCGLAYSIALTHSADFALKAHRQEGSFVNERARLRAVAMGGAFDRSIQLITLRIRCAAATQFAILATDRMIAGDPARIEAERRRRCHDLGEETSKRGGDDLVRRLDTNDLADSARLPAARLSDEIMNQPGGPAKVFALADGFSELSAGWIKRAALILAALTILAIALYLFGQAYAMGDTVAGRVLRGAGFALLCVAPLVVAWAWARPVAAPADARWGLACDGAPSEKAGVEERVEYAARRYGDGIAAFDRATTSVGREERSRSDSAAIEAFRCALRARPGFIPAYVRYEDAVSRADSPQRTEMYVSLSSKSKLAELQDIQLRELKAFVQADLLRPSRRLRSFGFGSTVLALVEGRQEALEEARTVHEMLTGQAPWWRRLYVQWMRPELWTDEEHSNSAIDWLNLGLVQAALGRPRDLADAERTYERALTQGIRWSPELLAATLTDLEILKAYCGTLHRRGDTCARIALLVDRARPRIAAGGQSGGLPSGSPAAVRGFRASATPYGVAWQATIQNFDPGRDRLTITWFRDDTAESADRTDPSKWQVRRVVPELSFLRHPGSSDPLPAADGDGVTRHTTSPLAAMDSCLAPGRYVAEVFLNGASVRSFPADVDAHDLHAFRSRELDTSWCIPREWRPWSTDRQSHPWLPDKPVRGFMTEDAARRSLMFAGAIMTFYAPSSVREPVRRMYFMHRAVQILLRKGAGGNGEEPSRWTQAREDLLVQNALVIDGPDHPWCRSREGVERLVFRFVPSPTDRTIVQIGVVSGDVRDACAILGSLRSYFPT